MRQGTQIGTYAFESDAGAGDAGARDDDGRAVMGLGSDL
jgi:hypothetical protein